VSTLSLFITRPPHLSPLFPYTTLFRSEYVFVYDIAGGEPKQRQALPVPNAYNGLVWRADGTGFYVSGGGDDVVHGFRREGDRYRSEEHTSELQSLTNLVCRLLLEKKTT